MNFQVVVVTGAASGIGAAIALSFAKLNAGLCITDKNELDLHNQSIECQKVSKNKVLEVVADIIKEEDIEKVISYALKEFGKIDVLVNCAGILEYTNLRDSNIMEKFDRIIAVNLRSVVSMSRIALPALIESKGCIINISSVNAKIVMDNTLIYSIAKAGVSTFTKCAAFELAKLGVRVNCISPGGVKTNIMENAGFSEDEINEVYNILKNCVPMKKIIKAEEIAEGAVYLASAKAASITGANLVIDAGMSLENVGTLLSPSSVN